MEDKSYVGYRSDDFFHFGASDVIGEELKYICKRRNQTDQTPSTNGGKTDINYREQYDSLKLTGLALSGGGIRSASFCLGVMQAMAHNHWLEKIDYLSTVSGGGYIGSSLSWLLSQEFDDEMRKDCGLDKINRFGLDRENFPYGTYPMVGADPKTRQESNVDTSQSGEDCNNGVTSNYRGKLLRYLRQHGKYLTPGDGINIMSLAAVILRGSVLSLSFYLGLLLLLFLPLHYLMEIEYSNINSVLWLALCGSCMLVVLIIGYSFSAYSFSLSKAAQEICQKQVNEQLGGQDKDKAHYHWRKLYEKYVGLLLTAILLLLVLGMVPTVYHTLQEWTANASLVSDFEISGSRAVDGGMQITGSISKETIEKDGGAGWADIIGGMSTLLGLLSAVLAFFKTGSRKKGIIPMGLLVSIGTAALCFGLLLLAYHFSTLLLEKQDSFIVYVYLAIPVFLLAGRFTNINYVSIHRYYRDRLMEAFMPDIKKVLCGISETKDGAKEDCGANDKLLCSLIDYGALEGRLNNPAPYHLINCNVVLESSPKPKFRARGGDNFILSPMYCGSNATGWERTGIFMSGRMNLPTAMATSGAAVNPGTGSGGDGVTRQKLLSMLMTLFNISLGYWAPNPYAAKKTGNKGGSGDYEKGIPNFFSPGLRALFSHYQLHEEAEHVQLTDGGHFENLGLYELIRRRARLIIVCDAGADPDYDFSDLSNAIEKVRVDFGALIQLTCEDLKVLVPSAGKACAQRGYLTGDILYPNNSRGRLIYIKTTFFKELSADLYGYKKAHPEFPDQSTGDQFFDEKQFEAYRELGFQTAWDMMKDNVVLNDIKRRRYF